MGIVKWVLDTSALFHLEEMPQGEVYTSTGVLRELEDQGDNRTGFLPEIITVLNPTAESLGEVDRGAKETGDDARVSPVDREVLALAIDLKATLISDDYSLQNLASHLGVGFTPIGKKGITREIKWRYKCEGCGRVWSRYYSECPVCGSALRSFHSSK